MGSKSLFKRILIDNTTILYREGIKERLRIEEKPEIRIKLEQNKKAQQHSVQNG